MGGGVFEREVLFNLERTMLSVLHKELQYAEYNVEKLKYKKVGGHECSPGSESNLNLQLGYPQQSPVPISTPG